MKKTKKKKTIKEKMLACGEFLQHHFMFMFISSSFFPFLSLLVWLSVFNFALFIFSLFFHFCLTRFHYNMLRLMSLADWCRKRKKNGFSCFDCVVLVAMMMLLFQMRHNQSTKIAMQWQSEWCYKQQKNIKLWRVFFGSERRIAI